MEIYRRGLTNVFERENKIVKTIQNFNGLSISGLREIAIYSRIKHPNIQKAQFEIFPGYFQFQFDRGFSLAYITRNFNIAVTQKISIANSLIMGLKYLHYNHILHRDLTNHNVLIYYQDGSYIAKISDFGSITFSSGPWLKTMTREVYHLNYRSPEVYRGENYGYPADMWSLGCLILEIFNGKQVYPGDNGKQVYQSILNTSPDFSLIKRDYPDLYPMVVGYLQHNPINRKLFVMVEIDQQALTYQIDQKIIQILLNFAFQKHIRINTVCRAIYCIGNMPQINITTAFIVLLLVSKLSDYTPISISEIAEVLREDISVIYNMEITIARQYSQFLICMTPLDLALKEPLFELEKGEQLLSTILNSKMIYSYTCIQISKFLLADQQLITYSKYDRMNLYL